MVAVASVVVTSVVPVAVRSVSGGRRIAVAVVVAGVTVRIGATVAVGVLLALEHPSTYTPWAYMANPGAGDPCHVRPPSCRLVRARAIPRRSSSAPHTKNPNGAISATIHASNGAVPKIACPSGV